jgi:hypothetical protein
MNRNPWQWLSAIVLSAAPFFTACGTVAEQSAEQEVSIRSDELAAYSGVLSWWPNGVVQTCFKNPDGIPAAEFNALSQQILQTLRATWQASSNVTFTGGGTCAASAGTSTMKISLPRFVRNADGTLSLGANGLPLLDSAHGQCGRDNCSVGIGDPARILDVAVHEVGHGLGFGHEHQRAVIGPNGPTWEVALCAIEQQREVLGLVGQRTPDVSLIALTGFDPVSIMNYCGIPNGRLPGDPSLSEGDKLGVEVLYPRSLVRQPLLSSSVLTGGGGELIGRSDLELRTDWSERGVPAKVFGLDGVRWRVDNLVASFGTTFPMLILPNYGAGFHTVTGDFVDTFGRQQSVAPFGSAPLVLNTGLHTAIVMSAL